jgi:predicted lipoprotein
MALDADSAIAFPVDPAKVDALLADCDAPVTQADVSRRGSDQRGLEAIGHALDRGPRTARACSYLTAAAALVAARADAVLKAWTEPTGGKPSALDQLRTPGGESMWADAPEVMADLVNGPIAALNLAADRQLGPVAGAGGAPPDPTAAPALADIVATVDSAGRMVDGGLAELVRAQSGATFTRLDRQLTDSRAALAAVPATPDGRPAPGEPVERAYGQVRAARITMRTEVASQLGVTLSFSDSDGDS